MLLRWLFTSGTKSGASASTNVLRNPEARLRNNSRQASCCAVGSSGSASNESACPAPASVDTYCCQPGNSPSAIDIVLSGALRCVSAVLPLPLDRLSGPAATHAPTERLEDAS